MSRTKAVSVIDTDTIYGKITDYRVSMNPSSEHLPQLIPNVTKSLKKEEKLYNEQMEDVSRNMGHLPNIPTMTVVRNILFGQGIKADTTLQTKLSAVKYIIENVCELSPEQYYAIYSVENNKKFCIYTAIAQIAEAAPDSVKKECCFYPKNILFRMLYPDLYYEKIVPSYDPYAIALCKDADLKRSLIRAGSPDFNHTKSSQSLVDEVIMNVLVDIVYDEKRKLMSEAEVLEYLMYFSKEKKYGINEVIRVRGYDNAMDFYFLNSPAYSKKETLPDFLKIRAKAGFESNYVVDALVAMCEVSHPGITEELQQIIEEQPER